MKRFILQSLVLWIAWIVLWRVAALMEYLPHASMWFPPAGLSFAAFMVMGIRAFPALLFGSMAASVWVALIYGDYRALMDEAQNGLLFGLGHCVFYFIGAQSLRFLAARSEHYHLPLVIIAFLISGTLASFGSAYFGASALAVGDVITWDTISDILLAWWIGDLVGVIILTPLFLAIMSWYYPQIERWLGGIRLNYSSRGWIPYVTKLAIIAAIIYATLYAADVYRSPEIGFAIFFMLLPQMWIAYTESAFRVALSLAAASTWLAILVAHFQLVEMAFTYQFALCVIAANAYFALAVPALTSNNQLLHERAYIDGLTKVFARDYFIEKANNLVQAHQPQGEALSLIMFDLDNFKAINDELGHTAGDHALKEATKSVRTKLRSDDLIGRFGGDEFMVLIPGEDVAQASATAERLRQAIATVAINEQFQLSASFGVVQLHPAEHVLNAIERVDKALFEAKRAGRNRVHH